MKESLLTKLCIPFDVKSSGAWNLLVAYSKQRILQLTSCLIGKMLIKGLSLKEYAVLFWLGERLNPLQRGKVYYLLTLYGNTGKSKRLIDSFEDWFWPHLNLDSQFPSFKGDFKSQAARLAKQLDLKLSLVHREGHNPRELRRMGIGYRDKGSLSTYNFNWRDYPVEKVQVIFQVLFARLTDDLVKFNIERAKKDLTTFGKIKAAMRKLEPSDESLKQGRNLFSLPKSVDLLVQLRAYEISETESRYLKSLFEFEEKQT